MAATPEQRPTPPAFTATDRPTHGIVLPLQPRGRLAESEASEMGHEERLKPARGLLIGLVAGLLLWAALGMAAWAVFRR